MNIALTTIYPPPIPPEAKLKFLGTGAVIRDRTDFSDVFMIALDNKRNGITLQQLRDGATSQYGHAITLPLNSVPSRISSQSMQDLMKSACKKMENFDYIGMISNFLPKV